MVSIIRTDIGRHFVSVLFESQACEVSEKITQPVLAFNFWPLAFFFLPLFPLPPLFYFLLYVLHFPVFLLLLFCFEFLLIPPLSPPQFSYPLLYLCLIYTISLVTLHYMLESVLLRTALPFT